MNIFDDYNIDYDNNQKQLFIKVVSEKDKFLGILMEKNELVLEVHYHKNLRQFIQLNGSLGEKLKQSDLNDNVKLERILEVFNNKLWDYFHPQFQNKKKQLP